MRTPQLSSRRGAVALAFAALLVGCDQPAEAPTDDAARAAADRERGALPYALDAAANDWPPLVAGSGSALAPAELATVNYYVVLDGSGSMRSSGCSDDQPKIKVAIEALAAFTDSVPADANLGLAAFDKRGVSERVALGRGNRAAVHAALQQVWADEGTPLRSAINLGYRRLLEQGRLQLGYGEYHLVVVTDGVPDPASEDPTEMVQELLAGSPVVLHTIGFCIGEDHVLNQPGRSYYVAAGSVAQLQAGLGAVLAEAPSFDQSAFAD